MLLWRRHGGGWGWGSGLSRLGRPGQGYVYPNPEGMHTGHRPGSAEPSSESPTLQVNPAHPRFDSRLTLRPAPRAVLDKGRRQRAGHGAR